MRRIATAIVVGASLILITVGCGGRDSATARGQANLGRQLLSSFGCGGCHEITGVAGADGQVGPSLRDLGDRRFIAGSLPNTSANVARWVDNPKAVDPDTLMPNLDLTTTQAQAIADYLLEH